MKLALVIIAVALLTTHASQAEIFTVQITNAYGSFAFSESKRFLVDLGTNLESIREARFICTGILSTEGCKGLFYAYLGDNFPDKRTGHVVLDPYQQATGTIVSNETPTLFTNDVPFQPFWNVTPSWDFLLDGEADGLVRLFISGGSFPEIQYPITGIIHSASIVIDATPIPEPGHLLLFLLTTCFATCQFRNKRIP